MTFAAALALTGVLFVLAAIVLAAAGSRLDYQGSSPARTAGAAARAAFLLFLAAIWVHALA